MGLHGLDARERDGERTPGVDAGDRGPAGVADRCSELDELAGVRVGISSVSLRTVSVVKPAAVNSCALLRAPLPTATMPFEPKTSPRTS